MAAGTYQQLAGIAGAQGRWDEAERCYRKSIDLNLRHNNPSAAAIACGELGRLLAETEGLTAATHAFLASAIIGHGIDGRWPDRALMALRVVKAEVPGLIEAAVKEDVPAELQESLLRLL